jgi:hypothetical protein
VRSRRLRVAQTQCPPRPVIHARTVNSLFVGLIAGVFGMAYFVYGKRRTHLTAMVAGVTLCIYPYFIDSLLWLCVVGVLLLVVPFVIDY